MVVGGMLVYVSVFVMVLFWTWRSRIPYAVELLRTTVVFLRDYPGPVRIGTPPSIRARNLNPLSRFIHPRAI
jgi:hypothetical protein